MVSPIAALAQQQLRDMQQLQQDFGRRRRPKAVAVEEAAVLANTRANRNPWRRVREAWSALLGHRGPTGRLQRPT